MKLVLFWTATAAIVYTYALFPLLLVVRGWRRPRPYLEADVTPTVSLILAAHNEADNIAAKLENVLALDYPPERLQLLVASDGSDDGTNEIVAAYAARGATLLPLPRLGKAAALNAAVAAANGDILVFSDANSIYAPGAIRALVRPFADPQVGGVAGNQQYLNGRDDSAAGKGEKSYWHLDRLLKAWESQAGNTISATGAIYAIRRPLFQEIPGGVTDDFFTSTGVIARGYRLVFAPGAVAYEPVAASARREFGRKVRVISRGLRAVLLRRELLNPWRYGFYALQLFWHKLLRRLMAFPLLLLALVSPLLWRRGRLYRAATLAQLGFYGLAGSGWLLRQTPWGSLKLFAIPFYFCLVNAAALVAAGNLLRGERIERWKPERN
jgi:cellulose synthase/poly-beta-1,6-N-acetylglucosamine synthase-like glycosyltransferase